MRSETTYSIVVPVYNSAATLYELYARLKKAMGSFRYEVILVDDGSSDNSWECIRDIGQQESNIKGVRLDRNYGQHIATLCGFDHSTGDFVVTIDDDIQHDPIYIPQMIARQMSTGADIVYASSGKTGNPFLRNVASSLFRLQAKILGYRNECSSFRLVTRKIIEFMAKDMHQNYVFIDAVLPRYTSSIIFVPVPKNKRRSGVSGYTALKLFRLYFSILKYYVWPVRPVRDPAKPIYNILSQYR